MARDPYKYFRIEAQELIDQLNRAALDLEKGSAPGIVAQLLRLAHTLKGAARVVKRSDIGDCAHAIEDTLAPLRESKQQATRAQIDTLLKHLDDIHGRLASIALPAEEQVLAPTAASTSTVHSSSEEILRTVRVDVGEMDNLLEGFGEVHTRLSALRDSLDKSENVRQQIALLEAQSIFKTIGNEDAGSARSRTALEQLGSSFEGLHRKLVTGIEELERELKQVRDAAERMRLIPADSLFVALERAVRDAAQVQNKRVSFEGSGGQVRLDAQVLGAVQAALSHVVRNAVTHGIESVAKRQASGKPVEGRVAIKVIQSGRWIDFICTDDGNGIDLTAIRSIAEQRGLLANGNQTDAASLMQLLLKGGISTSETITTVAGRGVGLDVVRDAAARLDGKVILDTESGKGTTVTLRVPLLIASLDGLLIEAGGLTLTLPIDSVKSTLRIAPCDIARTSNGESIIHNGHAIPFLPLTQVLFPKAASARGTHTWSAVIIEASCGMAAIGVERLLGANNIVLRPLPELAPAKPIVAGLSFDVEGNPQLVLDAEHLVMAVQRAMSSTLEFENVQHTILVIDDSLTTRMLERSILESAGYIVELAVSAEDALEKVSKNRYSLFLVDVEMPGMDGFGFIEQIRDNNELRDIPAILVTSLASEEYLQRGRDVGAQGYIIKSEFDQGVLLARIKELVT